jgi:hypothetical protein
MLAGKPAQTRSDRIEGLCPRQKGSHVQIASRAGEGGHVMVDLFWFFLQRVASVVETEGGVSLGPLNRSTQAREF